MRSFGLGYEAGLQGWRLAVDANAPEGSRALAVEASDTHKVTAVRLASRVGEFQLKETRASTEAVVLEPAAAIDAGGNVVYWDRVNARLMSIPRLADEHPELEPIALTLPAEAAPVADLTVTDDDALVVAGGDALWFIDLRARFEPTRFAIDGFIAHKLAALPGGGLVALDVVQGRLARITGLPPFTTGVDVVRERDDRFESCESNPRALHAFIFPARFESDERPVGIACNREGVVVALSLRKANGGARVRMLRGDGRLSIAWVLNGLKFPHTVGWLDARHLAVATQGVIEEAGRPPRDPGVFVHRFSPALRTALNDPEALAPDASYALGDFYPLARWDGGPFINSRAGMRLHYLVDDVRLGKRAAPVARISAAARHAYGVVANFEDDRIPGARLRNAVGVIDTRNPANVWHRLVVEACVPAGSAMVVWLAANDGGPPAFAPNDPRARTDWHAHVLGDRRALPQAVLDALPRDTPQAAWMQDASEVPFGESLLGCEREPGRTGVFTALIQRAGLAVRRLQGPRLWIAVELFGDGRASPELVAVRAHGGRVSYRDQYLPALYHETTYGPPADRLGTATGADFLERFIHLFEHDFTALEDRVALAHLLTDPHACPPDALEWLGTWIGTALEPGTPTERARLMIANAPRLAQTHGTLAGMQLALDIATDGGVTKGRLVVVEHWRLRRTLATILGADLSDESDPLTSGITQSGNSFVGDSLFLGDENVKTFLALFRDLRVDPKATTLEAKRQRDEREAALHALYDGLAFRATVLVHEAVDDDEYGLVRRVAQTRAPAHVLVNITRAKYPFIAGVASLIGADTFLRAPEPTLPARVEASQLGYRDTLQGLGSLDAHAGAFDDVLAPAIPPPVARIRADRTTVGTDDSFTLDGGESSAASGHEIDLYRWTYRPPQ
ncbi:MAG TPA: phage tail protein [Burkholderiaceae bacterium]|nr:phage tail protein [Burkholderiaceae bacterium]